MPPLETADFISELVPTNPLGTDPKSQGDDHLRLIKAALQGSFPNVDAEVPATAAEMASWEARIAALEGVAVGPVALTGETDVLIPMGGSVNRIVLGFDGVQADATALCGIRLAVGGVGVSPGYESGSHGFIVGSASIASTANNRFRWVVRGNGQQLHGRVVLDRFADDPQKWMMSGVVTRQGSSEDIIMSGSWTGPSTPVDGVVFNASEAYTGGLVYARYYVDAP